MGKTLLTLIKNKIKKLKLERRYGEHNDQNIKDYCHCFVIKLEILMKQYSCSKWNALCSKRLTSIQW